MSDYYSYAIIVIVSVAITSLFLGPRFIAVWQMFKDADKQEKQAKAEARFNAAQQMINPDSSYNPYDKIKLIDPAAKLPPTEAEVWNHAIDAVLEKLQSGWWAIDEIRGMKR